MQDLEITCSDPDQKLVALTLDTALVGFVRSKGRAGACMRRAEVCITPAGLPGMPMTLAYPPLCVERDGRANSATSTSRPWRCRPCRSGRYTLTATFVLDTRASGVCDSHAVADFSPDTALPPEWVRTRDPFQGVSKKSFGFTATLTAAPPAARDPVAPAALSEAPPPLPPPPALAERRSRRPAS